MKHDPRALRPEDRALLDPQPAGVRRFLVFSGDRGAWRMVDGGATLEAAKRLAYDHIGRGWSFTVEQLAVNEAPWPEAPVLPSGTCDLRCSGLLLAVPLHINARSVASDPPTVVMNVVEVPPDLPTGEAALSALRVRGFLGRVHDIIDLEMGYEKGSLRCPAPS